MDFKTDTTKRFFRKPHKILIMKTINVKKRSKFLSEGDWTVNKLHIYLDLTFFFFFKIFRYDLFSTKPAFGNGTPIFFSFKIYLYTEIFILRR